MDKTKQFEIKNDAEGTTIIGTGALDLYNEDFCAAVKEASVTAEDVIVDLRQAIYIDTAILASLAGAAARLIKRDKRLKVLLLEGTHPVRALKIAGFGQIMDLVLENTKEAE